MSLSHRKVTISTSGLVPVLKKMQQEDVFPNLAISLNATTDEVRTSIMPLNERWNIEELMATCREFPIEPRRRIMFEYVMIKGVTDSDEDARRLVSAAQGSAPQSQLDSRTTPTRDCPTNVPPSSASSHFARSSSTTMSPSFMRRTRGDDIAAACGQLAYLEQNTPAQKEPDAVAKKIYLATFGCRTNQADSAYIRESFLDNDFQETESAGEADVIVVNSCTVTHRSDQQVRQLSRRLRRENPGAKIVVTGCYAQREPEAIARIPGVDAVVGNTHRSQLVDIVRGAEPARHQPRRAGCDLPGRFQQRSERSKQHRPGKSAEGRGRSSRSRTAATRTAATASSPACAARVAASRPMLSSPGEGTGRRRDSRKSC